MKIAVASGKGGTGKSTVASNFAYLLSKTYKDIALLDCDVEEPNCHIFLKPMIQEEDKVYVPVPVIDKTKCVSCGKCSQVCQFNSMAFVKGDVLVFEDLCHGCGSCKNVCEANAITEKGRLNGYVESGRSYGFRFIQGRSRIGESMSPPLIKAVKAKGRSFANNIQILDCPPGTSCPVITAVEGVDYVILVTEPTPFGLNDLQLAADVIEKLNIPYGVVINRYTEGNTIIEDWAKPRNIKIIASIPNKREIAECYSKGKLLLKEIPAYEEFFKPLVSLLAKGE